MSSRYQKAFTIPDGFPMILKRFTREVRAAPPTRLAAPPPACPDPASSDPDPEMPKWHANPLPCGARDAKGLTDPPRARVAPSSAPQILRAQPDNIYEFGATYFADKIEENEREQDRRERAARGEFDQSPQGEDSDCGAVGMFDMTDDELQDFIMDQFMRYDADQDGYLDRREFRELLMDAELGLSKKDARAIMAEADENDDGALEYREFVPIMVEIIHGIKAKTDAAAVTEEAEDEAREVVEMHLLHGMPREELEAMMRGVFEAADTDGNGTLDRKEFSRCLKSAELGLTRKEINLLLGEVDENNDGMVSYDEFVPLCFNILVERFKDDVLAETAMQSEDALTELLIEEFEAKERKVYDAEDVSGTLPFSKVKRVLQSLSDEMLSLSRLQISAVMSEAKTDEESEERMVDYTVFAPVAARIIYSMVDLSHQAKRVDAVAKLSQSDGARILDQLDASTIKEVIRHAFHEADVDGNGTLDPEEMRTVLQALGSGELALSPGEINAMIAAIDSDEDGAVEYEELVDFLFDVLSHLERERYIQDNAFGRWEELDEAETMEHETVQAEGEEEEEEA